VTEREGQVDPQPRAEAVRPATTPLRGAKITNFTSPRQTCIGWSIRSPGETRAVQYEFQGDGGWRFEYIDGHGHVQVETFARPERGVGNRRGEQANPRPPRDDGPSAAAPVILTPKRSGKFILASSAVANGGPLSPEYNGDGEGSTLPLEWKGAPAGTKSYALVMDHVAPDGMKCYWTIWDIPSNVTNLPKNAKGVGKLGATWKKDQTYVAPHSQGPGKKTYTLTVYALSSVPHFDQPQGEVTRDVLLTAIKDLIVDSAELKVTYTAPTGDRDAKEGQDKKPQGPPP
jgi:phosphatidylethanolamine-binding protein (PEBP) family uncharacterized protein